LFIHFAPHPWSSLSLFAKNDNGSLSYCYSDPCLMLECHP